MPKREIERQPFRWCIRGVIASCLLSMLATPFACAQSTSVELLGTITAQQASNGLGFNLDPSQDWEWATLAAAGATHARMQCSWALVEKQTPPPRNAPATPQYVNDPNCTRGLVSAHKYGIHPTIVAAYGAPNHAILTVTVPSGAPVGASTLVVEMASGVGGDTLGSLAANYDYICPVALSAAGVPITRCASQFSGAHSYQGTLVTNVRHMDATHAVLTLASALKVALPAGSSRYMVSEILYPSTISFSPDDPSVAAYSNYVNFLASDMAAHGVTGDIELWNEPPWPGDPWTNRCNLYDAALSPCPSFQKATVGQMYPNAPNYGFAANLQGRNFPPGITLTWAGTNFGSNPSLIGPNMYRATGVHFRQPATLITTESFHPYGGPFGNPEDSMGTMDCLRDHARREISPVSNDGCYLSGERDTRNAGSNLFAGIAADLIAKRKVPGGGIGHSITETNLGPIPVNSVAEGIAQQAAQARFNLRQFLGFQALGVTPIEFFKLWNGQKPSPGAVTASFVDYDGVQATPLAGYTALAGLMTDLKPISSRPVSAYPDVSLLSVSRYAGTYPLTTVHLVGARKGSAANSDFFAVWQRSVCSTRNCWNTLASPPEAPLIISVPPRMHITAVRDLLTRKAVDFKVSGSQCTLKVADNPVEILADPQNARLP